MTVPRDECLAMSAQPRWSWGRMSPPLVVACMKLVELGAAVDPLTGHVTSDPLSAAPSSADQAALEWALRIGEVSGGEVVAVSAGGPRCEEILRGALAAGAARAVRTAVDASQSSAVVAGAVAGSLRVLLARSIAGQSAARSVPDALARSIAGQSAARSVPDALARPIVVCCGDASLDRGSGSFPAFLAGELRAAQALGLVAVNLGPVLEVERRLDLGRRERLRLVPPCVISVEATTARLRRASLPGVLAARSAPVEVIDAVVRPELSDPSDPKDGNDRVENADWVEPSGVELVGVEPFRPRARVVAPPAGDTARVRILSLTGASHDRQRARVVVLEAEAAAAELLSALSLWVGPPSPALSGSSLRNDR